MTALDGIRARAANIASGSIYSQAQTAADYTALLAEIDRRTTDLIAEQNVRQDEWDHASELLKNGVKSISHWEQQTVAAQAERDRYRLAWQSARKRAARLAEASQEAMQDMATELYRAEDRLAFVREMCDQADAEQREVTTGQVRAWTQYTGCANATPDGASLAQSLGFALAAMQPSHEPVFCHHEHAQHGVYETHQAGWGRKTVRTVSCPTCKARAESTEGEPVLAPTVLNAERCTEACTEQHTYRNGCLMQPTLMRGSYPAKPGHATVAADRCPQCGGDNTEPWALCGSCETVGEQR